MYSLMLLCREYKLLMHHSTVSSVLLFIGNKSVHIQLGLLSVVGPCGWMRATAEAKELRRVEGLTFDLTLKLCSPTPFLYVLNHHVNDWILCFT